MSEQTQDTLIYGAGSLQGLVAVEIPGDSDDVSLFVRDGAETRTEKRSFRPYIVFSSSRIKEIPGSVEQVSLEEGAELDRIAFFENWKACDKAKRFLARETGVSPGAANAPYLFIRDPVQQYLMFSGETLFKGMEFADLKRMQVDIECVMASGYEFCNADREEDEIVAIGVGLPDGKTEVVSGVDRDEKAILERLVELILEYDPDVIEGHNIFNFDLPYIAARAKRHAVRLAVGRDGSVPLRRPSRLSLAERNFSYDRFEIFGRHVVDTLFLVHAYDISHRALTGFGLKDVAVHFGVAPKGRTYIEGSKISETYRTDPKKVLKYVGDDIAETRGIAGLLSTSAFLQSQMLPFSYQNTAVRGNATKIDAMMVRAYMDARQSIPLPAMARAFAGGYTDMFVEGVVEEVHHCDVRSLYPSLMLTRDIGPASDRLGVFLEMLSVLRDLRLSAKASMGKAEGVERSFYDALQSTFKVLINSFYGYLGFAQGKFSDFEAADTVTSSGRELLKAMVAELRELGANPVEIDTDGIYFAPPDGVAGSKAKLSKFRDEFCASLPEGIDVEFDGEYDAMFSYKMKNYALLERNGEIVIKGGALKSRGLEPFLRDFLEQTIGLILRKKDKAIPDLKTEFESSISGGEWDIKRLAKTETLQDSPAVYAAKIEKGKRNRSACYELALKDERQYRQGDQISYYVIGEKKSVSVYDSCKMVSEWNPEARDENKAYYISKLDALFKKFSSVDRPQQGELAL
jgi:DNA polymerase elongation subunit (family B)